MQSIRLYHHPLAVCPMEVRPALEEEGVPWSGRVIDMDCRQPISIGIGLHRRMKNRSSFSLAQIQSEWREKYLIRYRGAFDHEQAISTGPSGHANCTPDAGIGRTRSATAKAATGVMVPSCCSFGNGSEGSYG